MSDEPLTSVAAPPLVLERYLSEKEVARMLGLAPATLADQRHKRKSPVPYVRFGGTVRYPLGPLQAYLKARTVEK